MKVFPRIPVFLCLLFLLASAMPAAAVSVYAFRGDCPPGWFCSGGVTATLTMKDSYVPGAPVERDDIDTFVTSAFGGPPPGQSRTGSYAAGRLPASTDWTPATVTVHVATLFLDPVHGWLIDEDWGLSSSATSGYWEATHARPGGSLFEEGLAGEWRLVSTTSTATVPLPAAGWLLGGALAVAGVRRRAGGQRRGA